MKKKNDGFTLAELLIVVAIIAVLVAIAIPIFTSQLEKSRDSVSISNIRAAYAEASAGFLTYNGQTSTGQAHVWITLGGKDAQGNQLIEVQVDKVAFKGTADGFSGLGDDLPFEHSLLTGNGAPAGGIPDDNYVVFFSFNTVTGDCSLVGFFNTTTNVKYTKEGITGP